MSSWADRLGAAVQCWERGDLDGAATLLRAVAAAADPETAREASYLLAGVLEEQGDVHGARAAHRSVIDSGDPVLGQRSAISLGMLHINMHEWAAAHGSLALAAQGADSEVAALADAALVQVLTRLGDVAGARGALERARCSDSPEVAELAAGLRLPDITTAESDGQALLQTYERAESLLAGGSAAAEAVFRQLLTCGDPDLVSRAAFRLYQGYVERQEREAAREVILRAIAVGHPDHLSMAHRLLGAVLFDLGEYTQARDAYRRTAEDPRPELRLPALIEEAKLTALLGDEEATKAIFHRVIAAGHAQYALEAKACLGQMHTEAGRTAEALGFWREVLATGDRRWASTAVSSLAVLHDQADGHGSGRGAIRKVLHAATGHPDPDAAFKARRLLDHAAMQQPLADPAAEQALQDTDGALERLRAGDLRGARALLHRAIDAEVPRLSGRAATVLALLELGEGDVDLADELLSHVAHGAEPAQGFGAALLLHLLRSPRDGAHPVLLAAIDHQRYGREQGLARYRAASRDRDPGTAVLATAMLAELHTTFGTELHTTFGAELRTTFGAELRTAFGAEPAKAAETFRTVADAGDPLALSYVAVVSAQPRMRQSRPDRQSTPDEVIALLRRARDGGHPALAPWVSHTLAKALEDGDDAGLAEARRAYDAVLSSGHPGLRPDAESGLTGILERQGDLLGLCALYERAPVDGSGAVSRTWLLGFTRVRLGRLEAAREAFARISESHPDLAAAGVYARHLLDRDFDAATPVFAHIKAFGEDDHRYLMSSRLTMETAHAWQRSGQTDAADRALSLMVADGHPGLAQEAAMYLGALRDDAGDEIGAIVAWDKAAAGEDPWTAVRATHGIGCARRSLGDLEGAAEAFRRVLDDGGEGDHAADAARQLGEVLAESGQVAAAREVFERLSGPDAVLGLAAAFHRAGDLPAAAAAYREAAESPDAGTAMVAATDLAMILDDQGDVAGAIAAGERAIAAGEAAGDPRRTAQASHNLGGHLAKAGDLDGARQAFERAAALDAGGAPRHILALGDRLELAGDIPGARAAFERAATLDDPEVAARARDRLGSATPEERAWLLADSGDRAGALAALTELHGSAAIAEFVLALGEAEPEALRPLVESLVADPGHAGSARRLLLMAAQSQSGHADSRRARTLLELAVEFGDPLDAAHTAIELAGLTADGGELARAESLALRAAECGDAEVAGLAWNDIATWRQRRGDTAGAVDADRRAMDSGDPHAVVSAAPHLASLLEESGDIDGARAVLGAGSVADHPGAAYCLRRLLILLVRHQDHGAAVTAAERAVATGDPETVAMGHWAVAEAKRAEGDLDAAVRLYRRGIDAGHPETAANLRLDLAELLYDQGETAAAKEELEHALCSADPAAVAAAGCRQGSRLHEEGDLAGAAEAFGRAAAAGHGHDLERSDWARTAVNNLFTVATRAHERDDHPLAVRALTFAAEAGEVTEAREAARGFGTDCASTGHVSATRGYYDAAMAFDPETRPLVEQELADLLAEHGDSGEALRTLRAAAEGGDPMPLYTLAQTLVEAGELLEGRAVYERVIDGSDTELAHRAMLALGNTYHDEDEDRAAGLYQRALEAEDPRLTALAAMYLGAFAKRRRDLPEALRWYHRVIDSGDRSEAPPAAAHLGELCYWLGDRAGSVRFYEQALAMTGRSDLVGEAAYRLGEISHLNGDIPRARELLGIAADSGDEHFAAAARDLMSRLG